MLALMSMILATNITTAVTNMAIAAIAAFTLSIFLTPIYTALAFRYKAWKRVRDTAMTGEKAEIFHLLHLKKHKRNIPTMAGSIMLVALTIVTVSLNLSREQTYLPLFGMIGAGLVGLLDDFINIRGKTLGIEGLRSRFKLALIIGIATSASLYFYYKLGYSSIQVPFWDMQMSLGILLIPLSILVIVATANAVNISDGLDGLSGGLLAIAFGTYAVIALLQGNAGIAVFCATAVGTLLAYTWFNIYPARFFMGDVGAFAFGAGLGIVAMLTDTILILPIVGGMFVIEAGSSLVQIISKKTIGRKIFISAPIHHHLEAMGWPETKVTMRFWVLGAICGASGIVIAVIGGSI
jgi:phospho-N-acetylmuramoyl-pentapeptide-transferase